MHPSDRGSGKCLRGIGAGFFRRRSEGMLGEMVRIQFRVRADVAEAFLKACSRSGSVPGEEIEAFMEGYVRDRIRDLVVARIDEGRAGQVQEELFRVDILCDDPLCITPRILMDGNAGEGHREERGAGEKKG
jgi:hypothetical protein